MLTLQKDLDKFWAKVNKTETCWLWLGEKNCRGFARYRNRNGRYSASYISYTLCIGEYNRRFDLIHVCNNIDCVNPDHLKLYK